MGSEKWLAVVNVFAASKKAGSVWKKAASCLEDAGVAYKAEFTGGKYNATELSRKAAERGYRKFIAVGGDGKIKDFIVLKRIKNVSPTDFYEYQGYTYLNISGRNYLVSDDVTCYKSINKLWFTNKTGTERLAACKAFSDKLSAYFDPISEQIRVVVAE